MRHNTEDSYSEIEVLLNNEKTYYSCELLRKHGINQGYVAI